MPTYEYECNSCGHAFELFQSMTAPVKRTCPECGKKKLARLIGTGAGVLFKGSGFYETDYRSESYRKAAEAEKNSTDDASKKTADPSSSGASSSGDSSTSGAKGKQSGSSSSSTADASLTTAKPAGKKRQSKKPAAGD